uniref:Teneurin N-terminal domain-containing protein n=1 Tax=Knipowitschia caucasica TaxID=637954 RepID=A0AAV2MM02_KNICA
MPSRCHSNQTAQSGDNTSNSDQAQLHNSWVLNSNIPLETRSACTFWPLPKLSDLHLSKFRQPQGLLLLPPAELPSHFRQHFLFKQGSGSSALLSGAGQGYPLTSGTVYSPPPRPLPRSSVTRPLFTFNKPHRCCNWKCTALSASLLTLTLALLLTYVIDHSGSLFLFNLGPSLVFPSVPRSRHPRPVITSALAPSACQFISLLWWRSRSRRRAGG